MKIILFSDLHANWQALSALQQAESEPDAILFAGDIVNFGPEPQRCETKANRAKKPARSALLSQHEVFRTVPRNAVERAASCLVPSDLAYTQVRGTVHPEGTLDRCF